MSNKSLEDMTQEERDRAHHGHGGLAALEMVLQGVIFCENEGHTVWQSHEVKAAIRDVMDRIAEEYGITIVEKENQ